MIGPDVHYICTLQAGILTAGGYYNGRLSLFYKLGESYDDPSNEDKWETAVYISFASI